MNTLHLIGFITVSKVERFFIMHPVRSNRIIFIRVKIYTDKSKEKYKFSYITVVRNSTTIRSFFIFHVYDL